MNRCRRAVIGTEAICAEGTNDQSTNECILNYVRCFGAEGTREREGIGIPENDSAATRTLVRKLRPRADGSCAPAVHDAVPAVKKRAIMWTMN